MIINKDYSLEESKIFLCNRLLERMGEIHSIENLKIDKHLQSNWECSFTIYKSNDGIIMPLWDDIVDLAVIEIEDFGYFEIAVPLTSDSTTHKEITGISLAEAELSQKNITIYFNSTEQAEYAENEDDPNINAVFYNPDDFNTSMLSRIFSYIPHYTIGHVDKSLYNLKRTFTCEDTTIDLFLKTIGEELKCIFLFRTVKYRNDVTVFSRTVDVYTLVDRCQECGKEDIIDGVCQNCGSTNIDYGYGIDSQIFIDDTHNLAEVLQIVGDKDSVKNCFKITGGDDEINNLVYWKLIGSNKLWKFSEFQTMRMTEDLQNGLIARQELIDSLQEQYDNAWDLYNENYVKAQYYQSKMMPTEQDEKDAEEIYNDIFSHVTYTCAKYESYDAEKVAKATMNYIKQFVPSNYTVEYLPLSDDVTYEYDTTAYTFSFKIHIYYSGTIEDYTDEYSSTTIVLPVKRGWVMYTSPNSSVFTTEYFEFLKQQLDYGLLKLEEDIDSVSFNPPLDDDGNYISGATADSFADYDEENDPAGIIRARYNHYTKYSYNRLKSFKDAYENAIGVLAELNSNISDYQRYIDNQLTYEDSNGNEKPIYAALMDKYNNRADCCIARMDYLKAKIDEYNSIVDSSQNTLREIKKQVDMKTFLENYALEIGYAESDKDLLWKELVSFERDDVYNNSNFIAEDLDDEVKFENTELLVEEAISEIKKACELNYSITTTLDNLLTLKEFKHFWNVFDLGNYLRIRIDGVIYKLRLSTINYDFNSIGEIGVEFIDVEKSNTPVSDVSEILEKASSIASSYDFVYRQAQTSEKTTNTLSDILQDGLNTANTAIVNANNQSFVIDKYGITGREYDEISDTFYDEQIKIINNLLCFTKDNWKSCSAALGKIEYDLDGQHYTAYGLLAQAIIGDLIISKELRIVNANSNIVLDENGILAYNDYNKVIINPNDTNGKLFRITDSSGVNDIIYLDNNGNANFVGKITASTITIENNVARLLINPTHPFRLIRKSDLNAVIDIDSNGNAVFKDGTITGSSFVATNNNTKVEISPNNPFKVTKINGSTGTDVIYIDTNGNANFSGSGKFDSGFEVGVPIDIDGTNVYYYVLRMIEETNVDTMLFGITSDNNRNLIRGGLTVTRGRTQTGTSTELLGGHIEINSEQLVVIDSGDSSNAGFIQISSNGNATSALTQNRIVLDGSDSMLELYHIQPFIDFHANFDGGDYTTRLIEIPPDSSHVNGKLHLLAYGDGTYGTLVANIENPSSRLVKENIESISEEEADKILELNPVSFDYKKGYGEKNQVGLIAEDVENVLPNIVDIPNGFDESEFTLGDHNIPNINYIQLIPYLLKKIQMMDNEIKELKEIIKGGDRSGC